MKRCAIITGGQKSSLKNISKDDFIIACDKGYEYCVQENIKPNLIIGDFDSLQMDLPKEIEIIRLQVRKDDTDTMHAISYCVENHFDEINLYCGLGKRFDHSFSNIQSSIYAAKRNVDCILYDDENKIIVTNKNEITLNKDNNNNLSIFAADEIKGLCISGSDYDCDNLDLHNDYPIGQSNHFIKEKVIIKKKSGVLIIICSKGC